MGLSHEDKVKALRSWGFVVGERDPRLNTRYSGGCMVVEEHEESELPTEDGANGPWCIVGDDLGALVDEAYRVWVDEYVPGGDRSLTRKGTS